MSSKTRDLIEYHGMNRCKLGDILYFKQINRDFTFCVPCQKPDIEQLVKVWVTPSIYEQKLVKTPKGTSLEGQSVTGYKLMIIGDLHYKVEYVALECEQSLHTAHTVMPFCGYVVLPLDFNPNAFVKSNVFIEDIHSEQLDCRCIYNNVTMMLTVDIC